MKNCLRFLLCVSLVQPAFAADTFCGDINQSNFAALATVSTLTHASLAGRENNFLPYVSANPILSGVGLFDGGDSVRPLTAGSLSIVYERCNIERISAVASNRIEFDLRCQDVEGRVRAIYGLEGFPLLAVNSVTIQHIPPGTPPEIGVSSERCFESSLQSGAPR